jgi:hypothetical protein
MTSPFKDTVAWEKLESDSWVLRLWDSAAPGWPEIALLHLSKNLYKDFRKNPSAFVNSHKIFSTDVRPHARCTQLKRPAGYAGPWMVFGIHHHGSALECTSSPVEEAQPAHLKKQKAAAA